jgi:hypothetical protein
MNVRRGSRITGLMNIFPLVRIRYESKCTRVVYPARQKFDAGKSSIAGASWHSVGVQTTSLLKDRTLSFCQSLCFFSGSTSMIWQPQQQLGKILHQRLSVFGGCRYLMRKCWLLRLRLDRDQVPLYLAWTRMKYRIYRDRCVCSGVRRFSACKTSARLRDQGCSQRTIYTTSNDA